MGYDEDPRMVRVDFFKPSGKWYTTVAMKWDTYCKEDSSDGKVELIHDIFIRYLREQFPNLFIEDRMIAVCLEPYHEHSHPLMVRHPGTDR